MADAANSTTAKYTRRQFSRFAKVVRELRARGVHVPMVHVENSEALLSEQVDTEKIRQLTAPMMRSPRNSADERAQPREESSPPPSGAAAADDDAEYELLECAGYCRVGGALYGQRKHAVLQPVLTLKAQVRHVFTCEAGMTVGYDRSWVTPRETVIATLAIGFADGFSRANSNRAGAVGVRGRRCAVAGKVCMDMTMLDLGPPPAAAADGEDGVAAHLVKVGEYATLFGKGGPSLQEAADSLETALSDLTCDLTRRVPRRYVELPDGWTPPSRYYFPTPSPVPATEGAPRPTPASS